MDPDPPPKKEELDLNQKKVKINGLDRVKIVVKINEEDPYNLVQNLI